MITLVLVSRHSIVNRSICTFASQNDIAQFSKAINRFTREDPTFRVRYDDESKEVCFKVAIINKNKQINSNLMSIIRLRNLPSQRLLVGEGKTGVLREKPLGARTRTNNKLNPHYRTRATWVGGIPHPHPLPSSLLPIPAPMPAPHPCSPSLPHPHPHPCSPIGFQHLPSVII